jgi:hypothetical protein
MPYRFVGEYWDFCYADNLEVGERKIIRGGTNSKVVINGETIALNFETTDALVQWKVSQKYSTVAPPNNNADNGFSISTSVEYEEVPMERDIRTGLLIGNSAGDFFNPPPTIKRKVTTYSITRRELGNPLLNQKLYTNVVNTDVFYNAQPGTLLMDSMSCSFDGQKWTVTYNIKEKVEGWQTILLDVGLNEINDDGERVPILNAEGTPETEPVKLDGHGKKLAAQDMNGFNLPAVWKYANLPFLELNLPNPYNVMTNPFV